MPSEKDLKFTSDEVRETKLNRDGTVSFILHDGSVEDWEFWKGVWSEVEQ